MDQESLFLVLEPKESSSSSSSSSSHTAPVVTKNKSGVRSKYCSKYPRPSWEESALSSADQLTHLEEYLTKERLQNTLQTWSKLDKTDKLVKLVCFAEKYQTMHQLKQEEYTLLVIFFKDCMDKHKLCKIKDLVYDKELGKIVDIPSLVYHKSSNRFTLKYTDKRESTLKGLTPKKKKQRCNDTKKKHYCSSSSTTQKEEEDDDENDDDEAEGLT